MPRDTFLLLPIEALACIVVPALIAAWKAVQDRRKQSPDLDDTDFCGWYDTGPDLPAEMHSARLGSCRGGSPTTAAAAFPVLLHVDRSKL